MTQTSGNPPLQV